jgi:YggT family protein
MVALVNLLVLVLYLYTWVIILRAVISWVRPDPDNPFITILITITEPVLKPLRAIIPPRALAGIDVSPILAIVLIQIVRYLLLALAY